MNKPWKLRARTCGTDSPSRSEALSFIDSAKSPSTKIDGSLVNFRYRQSNRHGRPRRMLIQTFKGTLIGLWAHLRDSHNSQVLSLCWNLAWLLAQQNNWNEKGWPGYDILVHEKQRRAQDFGEGGGAAVAEGHNRARRASSLGGPGACSPGKFWTFKCLKWQIWPLLQKKPLGTKILTDLAQWFF